MKTAISTEIIHEFIYLIRGHKVMIDSDLASLYHVEVRILVQAVKRNLDRFPPDFMFQLSAKEAHALRSQIVSLKTGRGKHRKYLPYVFTEQGVAMLSSVLRSRHAIQVNISIMRAFVNLRRLIAADKDLAKIVLEHEQKIEGLTATVKSVCDVIQRLTDGPKRCHRKIGF
jgi:hypothetical protein